MDHRAGELTAAQGGGQLLPAAGPQPSESALECFTPRMTRESNSLTLACGRLFERESHGVLKASPMITQMSDDRAAEHLCVKR
jgi:hypothetical protein